jgi:hypothetical protein
MLIGLVLLAAASFLTLFVKVSGELIAVRALTGVAAAMTTPGTIALAFRLFDDDKLRIRAISAITTIGLMGLAAGPVVGGFLLSVLPWQSLLLINVPIALLAFMGIRSGIAPEQEHEFHAVPLNIVGALLGTATVVLMLATPTLFADEGAHSWLPWTAGVVALVVAASFVLHERRVQHPLVDIALIGQRLVSSGLAYKAATGLAMASLGYMVGLQLQLDWGWSPLLASLAMLPQVATLLVGGFFIEKLVGWVGIHKAALLGGLSVLAGLVVYGSLGTTAYVWVALALVCVAAGLRVVGVVAGVNVMKGVPEKRTSLGAALVDTTDEIASVLGVAVSGTLIATLFTGTITDHWTVMQTAQFHLAVTTSSAILALTAAALIGWAFVRSKET